MGPVNQGLRVITGVITFAAQEQPVDHQPAVDGVGPDAYTRAALVVAAVNSELHAQAVDLQLRISDRGGHVPKHHDGTNRDPE
jgi:hypothetical protein